MPLAGGNGLLLAIFPGGNHDHKSRQVLRFGTQTIEQPGTHGRAGGDHRTGVHKGVGWVVIDGIRMERPDNTDVIRTFFA